MATTNITSDYIVAQQMAVPPAPAASGQFAAFETISLYTKALQRLQYALENNQTVTFAALLDDESLTGIFPIGKVVLRINDSVEITAVLGSISSGTLANGSFYQTSKIEQSSVSLGHNTYDGCNYTVRDAFKFTLTGLGLSTITAATITLYRGYSGTANFNAEQTATVRLNVQSVSLNQTTTYDGSFYGRLASATVLDAPVFVTLERVKLDPLSKTLTLKPLVSGGTATSITIDWGGTEGMTSGCSSGNPYSHPYSADGYYRPSVTAVVAGTTYTVFLANPLVVNGGQTRFTSIVYRIATLSSPVADLAFNLSDGKLYVLTTDGNLYRSTNNALTWTAGGVQPFPEFALVASGITGTKLVCSGGYLFVLHGATITKYDTSGAVVLYWSTGLSTTGGDLVVTPTGNIAVAADSTTEYHDSGEIHVYDTVGGLLKTCTFTKSRNAAAPPTVTYQLCVDRTGQMLIQYTGPTWMEEVEDGTKTVSVCTYYWNGVVTSLSLSARLTYGVFYAHGQIPAALAFAASSTHLYLAGIDDTNTMICAYDGTIQTEMGGAPSLLSSPTDSWLSYYTSLDASAAATNFTADLKNLVALGNKVAGSAGSDLFLMQTPDVALSVTLTVTKQNGQIVTLKPTATATDGSAPIRTFVTCGDGTTLDNLTLGATVEHTFALGTYGMQAHCVDASGKQWDSTVVSVVINDQNPLCAFTAEVGANHRTVTINANSSTDPDGTVASWRFDPHDGTGWHAGVVGTPATYTYSAHNTAPQPMTVEVTDNSGATASSTVNIDIANRPPVVSADYSILRNTNSVMFRITPTITDADGDTAPTATLTVKTAISADTTTITVVSGQQYEVTIPRSIAQAKFIEGTIVATDDDGEVTMWSTSMDVAPIQERVGTLAQLNERGRLAMSEPCWLTDVQAHVLGMGPDVPPVVTSPIISATDPIITAPHVTYTIWIDTSGIEAVANVRIGSEWKPIK